MVDPKTLKLSEARVEEIMATLTSAGQGQAAEELKGHIIALEDEVTRINQYYEEFLIPQMEGRRIGRSSAGRARSECDAVPESWEEGWVR